MKKIFVPVLFLVAVGAVAAGVFLSKQKQQPPAPVMEKQMGAPAAAKEGSTPRQEEAAPQRPELEPAPLDIRFDAPVPPQMGQAVPVTLRVEGSLERWPVEAGPDARLHLLLRLPASVKLASEQGWSPARLPPDEKDDISGPWSVYEKQVPLRIERGAPPGLLAAEKLELMLTEEGMNWIISVRVLLIQGSQGPANAWQAFGTLFATLQDNKGEFHEVPKTPRDIQRAQDAQSAKES